MRPDSERTWSVLIDHSRVPLTVIDSQKGTTAAVAITETSRNARIIWGDVTALTVDMVW